MTPVMERARRRALRWFVIAIALCHPPTAQAQSDLPRVTYRTREIVFITAGRAERLGVGDTIAILAANESVLTRAVVISVAEHRASAHLLDPDADIGVGQRIRFSPRALADVAAAPLAAPDSGGVGLPPAGAAASGPGDAEITTARLRGPPLRTRGGLAVEQYASDAGNGGGLGSAATIAALDLEVPLGGAAQFLLRGNGRWRGGSSMALTASPSFQSVVYQGELRIQPAGGGWGASLGRFIPPGAIGLGYVDGGRIDVRVGGGEHLGVIGGFVPRIEDLQPSTETMRAGAYWSTSGGGRFDGSLIAAADWGGGMRRRTELAGQAFWRVLQRASASAYWELDLPAGTSTSTQLTTLSASLQCVLPLGFRAGVSLEAHEPIQIWNAAVPVDTTVPLPGRLTGASINLSHDLSGFFIGVSGGALKRVGDARATTQGSLTLSRGLLFVTALAQRGDLMDYESVLGQIRLPSSLPFSATLGAAASVTKTANGGMSFVRYSVRPEIAQYLGSGVLLSVGGDIGRYAGLSTVWLHAGVSYRLR